MAPYRILIERDEDGYIASDDISVVYGCGETPEEAERDYAQSFAEYLQILASKTEGLMSWAVELARQLNEVAIAQENAIAAYFRSFNHDNTR